MTKFSLINLPLSILLLFFFVNSAMSETTPTQVIRTSNNQILDIYKSSPTVKNGILDTIFSVMEEITDFKTMADRASQDTCKQTTTELCAQLKTEFIQLLKLTATNKLGRYRADRFEYLEEEISNNQAVVKTKAYFEEDEVQLDYILERNANRWRVVNYIADEIDTIRNYQSQFSRITKKKSVVFLINRLKKKNKQYLKERENQVQSQS